MKGYIPVMNLKEWWQGSGTETKTVQVIVFLLAFALSSDISNAAVSIAMGLAGVYIVADCIRKKSLAGFYTAKENWLGIAVFLAAVMLASVLLGDKESIRDAFKYIYWTLPFPIMVYLGKKAEIRYAALGGFLLSVAVTSGNMVWLHYLVLQGRKLAVPGGGVRLGAFLGNPNLYAMLLIGTFPLLICFLLDKKEQAQQKTWIRFLTGAVLALGFWSLWKTGSRGAMAGLFGGGILTCFVICIKQKKLKQFVTGFTVCVTAAAVFLLAGIRGGEYRHGDVIRMRLIQSSYAMWQDHKLLGVGLSNWRKEYSTQYILKEEIEKDAARQYQEWKKAAEKRAAAARKAEAAKKAAAQKAAQQKKTAVQKPPAQKQVVQKPKHQLTPEQKQAAARKAEAARKAAAKREAEQKAWWKKVIFKNESNLPMPHNVVVWFFSTTGVIGGLGYLFFVLYYVHLFCKRMKRNCGTWIIAAGLWAFLAIGLHGLVDAGITNKAAARLVYMVTGLALSYRYSKEKKPLPECGDRAAIASENS